MVDQRQRHRMVFECPEAIKRAIRGRAGLEGVNPADVIVAALNQYLGKEIQEAASRLREDSETSKPPKRHKAGAV